MAANESTKATHFSNIDIGTANGGGAIKVAGTQVLGAQSAAEADVSAPTAYSAHASGATAVTSNAATDLDTTAAALATLVTEVTAIENKLNALLAKLRTHGIIAT